MRSAALAVARKSISESWCVQYTNVTIGLVLTLCISRIPRARHQTTPPARSPLESTQCTASTRTTCGPARRARQPASKALSQARGISDPPTSTANNRDDNPCKPSPLPFASANAGEPVSASSAHAFICTMLALCKEAVPTSLKTPPPKVLNGKLHPASPRCYALRVSTPASLSRRGRLCT